MPQEGDDGAEEQLDHRDCVSSRGVDHRNAERSRDVECDVVDAHAGTAHHLELAGFLEELGGDARGAPSHDCIVVPDAPQQLVNWQSRHLVDTEPRVRGQNCHALGVDLVGD